MIYSRDNKLVVQTAALGLVAVVVTAAVGIGVTNNKIRVEG